MLPLAHSRCLLSCHRYGEILPPVQYNLATCRIQRPAAAWRLRSEQQAVRCGLPVIRPQRSPPRLSGTLNECSGDLAPTKDAATAGSGQVTELLFCGKFDAA